MASGASPRSSEGHEAPAWELARAHIVAVSAVTLDFGNTLVRIDWAGLRNVVDGTAERMLERGTINEVAPFLAAWAEERDRQFREEVPLFREVDLDQRVVRVLARLRGMPPPPAEVRWDDAAASTLVDAEEVRHAVEVYSAAFVAGMAPVADASATLERLASRGFRLGILSNWPLAATIDRFAEAQGWLPFLQTIVVSQRVGTIKPHPSIFRAAEAALGVSGSRVLHVGDDWAADVVGAMSAGWRAAYLRDRQADTPLPTSEPGDGLATGVGAAEADLVIDHLAELDAHLELVPAA
jgi:HAD superfamily hydrolase (TIGR01549 family)